MKKKYINPTITVVKIQTAGMLAGSPLEPQNNSGYVVDEFAPADGTGEGRYFDFDDEDEY